MLYHYVHFVRKLLVVYLKYISLRGMIKFKFVVLDLEFEMLQNANRLPHLCRSFLFSG